MSDNKPLTPEMTKIVGQLLAASIPAHRISTALDLPIDTVLKQAKAKEEQILDEVGNIIGDLIYQRKLRSKGLK